MANPHPPPPPGFDASPRASVASGRVATEGREGLLSQTPFSIHSPASPLGVNGEGAAAADAPIQPDRYAEERANGTSEHSSACLLHHHMCPFALAPAPYNVFGSLHSTDITYFLLRDVTGADTATHSGVRRLVSCSHHSLSYLPVAARLGRLRTLAETIRYFPETLNALLQEVSSTELPSAARKVKRRLHSPLAITCHFDHRILREGGRTLVLMATASTDKNCFPLISVLWHSLLSLLLVSCRNFVCRPRSENASSPTDTIAP